MRWNASPAVKAGHIRGDTSEDNRVECEDGESGRQGEARGIKKREGMSEGVEEYKEAALLWEAIICSDTLGSLSLCTVQDIGRRDGGISPYACNC